MSKVQRDDRVLRLTLPFSRSRGEDLSRCQHHGGDECRRHKHRELRVESDLRREGDVKSASSSWERVKRVCGLCLWKSNETEMKREREGSGHQAGDGRQEEELSSS